LLSGPGFECATDIAKTGILAMRGRIFQIKTGFRAPAEFFKILCPSDSKRILAKSISSGYGFAMTTTVDAIYENGKLLLTQPLLLPEKSHVRVTIETSDVERGAWLKLSETSLSKVWNNEADDIFNELLKK
jgi:predicted DNA-binding antitoxin AbrB/MazE fold protein